MVKRILVCGFTIFTGLCLLSIFKMNTLDSNSLNNIRANACILA